MVGETGWEEVMAVTEAAEDPAAAAGPREPGWEGFSSATRIWFLDAFPTGPTPVQERAWATIGRGENALVIAPTGSGKTLASFLSAIDRLGQEPAAEEQRVEAAEGGAQGGADGVRVLYISPLKALGADVERNLRRPLAGIAAVGPTRSISVGVRSAMKIMLVYFVLTVLVIYPFADEMMMLFVNNGEQEVIANAALLMRIANWFYPSLGVLVILRYSIQGLGYSNLSLMSGVMEMIARCGVSLWLVPALAWLGVCYGDPVAWIMADLFLVPAYLWLLRRLKNKERVKRLLKVKR